MLAMKLRNLLIGSVLLTAIFAGCSTVPDASFSSGATSPSPKTTDAPPPTTPATETTSARPADDYVDVGYGMSIPVGGPGDCTGTAVIYLGSIDGKAIAEILLPENLIDMGPRRFAQGEVTYDDQGRVATYTVAPGDVVDVIGKRFCTYDGGMLEILNGYKGYESIQPGDVLVVDPQAVPGFKYQGPNY